MTPATRDGATPDSPEALGDLASKREETAGAEAAYEFLIDNRDKFGRSGVVLNYLAYLQAKTGRPHEALSTYRAAQELGFENNGDIGALLESLGDDDGALSAYASAVFADPTDLDSLVNIGVLLCTLDREPEAISYLRRAADIDPKAQWQLADAVLATEGVDAAIDVLRNAIRAGEERAYVDLVELMAEELSLAEIRLFLGKAHSAGSHVAMSDLTAHLVDAEEYDDAIAIGISAIAEGDELVLGPLALAYEAVGQPDMARTLLSRAVAAGQTAFMGDFQRLAG